MAKWTINTLEAQAVTLGCSNATVMLYLHVLVSAAPGNVSASSVAGGSFLGGILM
jgi:hypothetical protein